MAAAQLWVGVVLPTALVLIGQGKSYLAHMRERERSPHPPPARCAQPWCAEWQYALNSKAMHDLESDPLQLNQCVRMAAVVTLQLWQLHAWVQRN